MASNRKPRKAYKPKRPSMPVIFRHDAESEQSLQMYPHAELLKFRNQMADEGSWHTITCRINIGLTLAHQNDFPKSLTVAQAGLEVMRQIYARQERMGKWGASDEELKTIGDALVTTDELQKGTTRRQLRAAVEHVYRVAAI